MAAAVTTASLQHPRPRLQKHLLHCHHRQHSYEQRFTRLNLFPPLLLLPQPLAIQLWPVALPLPLTMPLVRWN